MQLAFETEALRDICEIASLALEALGPDTASALKGVLSDLAASANLAEVPWFEQNTFSGADFRVQLSSQAALVLRPNHARLLRNAEGQIDSSSVTRVKLMSVEVPNGE